jgi:hypothetical protein
MKQGAGELVELYLEGGMTGGRLLCPQNLIPGPGQYLLTHDGSDAPLPVPIFSAGSIPGGFLIAPPIPDYWQPGITLSLRGPLGRGFSMPVSARCVALVALGETSARLNPILEAALKQNASVVLVSDLNLRALSPEIELQPVSALADVVQWADYLVLDIPRESLPGLREKLGLARQTRVKIARPGSWLTGEAQALISTPMPCGGIGDCAVCAVTVHRKWRMACKDGPVFNLNELF